MSKGSKAESPPPVVVASFELDGIRAPGGGLDLNAIFENSSPIPAPAAVDTPMEVDTPSSTTPHPSPIGSPAPLSIVAETIIRPVAKKAAPTQSIGK
jgi:hypothetical protein